MISFIADAWNDGWPSRLALGCFAVVVLCVVAIGHEIWREAAHPCLRYEKQWVRHPSWVQIISTGKTTIPIIHPAREGWEEVCVERKP